MAELGERKGTTKMWGSLRYVKDVSKTSVLCLLYVALNTTLGRVHAMHCTEAFIQVTATLQAK